MYQILPLFKSHYSLGRSILTLEKPTGKDSYPISIFDLLLRNKLDTLVLVDDNVSGMLQASKVAADNKIRFVFGLRLWVTDDVTEKNEGALNKRAKYIVFVKNLAGYINLTRIWSFAAKDGFYYEPCIDFKNLARYWDDKNLSLAIPFYDSFLYLNTLESCTHVPDLSFVKEVTFLIEDNSLPFDNIVQARVDTMSASIANAHLLKAQSIYYPKKADFLNYMAFRCLNKRTTLEKPELNHMSSDEFNFEKWLANEQTQQ